MTSPDPTGDGLPRAPLLDGMRVIDASTGIAGAYCTKLLCDAGADVVLVEETAGSPLRTVASSSRVAEGASGALFDYLHRGKRSVVTPHHDVEELVQLAGHSDVFVEDRPHSDSLVALIRERFPATIIVSISDFGADGPWTGIPAADITIQALASSIASRGEKTGTPVMAGGNLTEWAAGIAAAVAVLPALRARQQDGQGDHLDVSRLETAITIFNGFRAVSGQMAPLPKNPTRVVEVPSIEPARDGWVGFCTISHDHFVSFAELIDHADWASDPQISRIDVRCERAAELRPEIAAWTANHSVDEILEEATARHIPAAPVGNGETAPRIAHLADRGVFLDELDSQPRIPYRLSRTPQLAFGASPTKGSSDRAALVREWSRTESRIPAPSSSGGRAPLEGIRVFDMTTYWAGPVVSQILGYFGAEVIKIESIQRPDGTRFGTSYGMSGEQVWERAPLFQGVNTGKKGITLDLGAPEGRELAAELLTKCDVLVENFVPRVAEKFGLIDEPRDDLIVVRSPAWGLTGPWRDVPGFAQTTEQASGLAWVTGFADGPPLIPRGPCDPIGGFTAAFATLAAILERDRTGLGQLIEVPLIESALNVAGQQFVEYSRYGELVNRTGNDSDRHAPHGLFRCAGNDEWVAIAVTDDDQWLGLCDAIGQAGWASDESLRDADGRLAAREELSDAVGGWCANKKTDSIVGRLRDHGVPVAAMVLPHAVVDLEPVVDRGFFEVVEHPLLGRLRLPGFPVRSEGRGRPWHSSPAPLLGEHNREVLGGLLGMTDSHLADLASRRVIGNTPLGMS